MNRAMTLVGAVVLLAGAVLAGVLALGETASAAPEGTYEYAYLFGVQRLESYDIDVSRWAGTNEDKEYLKAHVFAYEQGPTQFSDQVNSLRKLNQLAGQGWEVVDQKSGLLRRKR